MRHRLTKDELRKKRNEYWRVRTFLRYHPEEKRRRDEEFFRLCRQQKNRPI
ncbi:MAG: hypothetical protein JW855_03310 [Gammaproteobacteria bacterium]|nr:hypothetical protein [Gammaproteobacteria bacterium]